MSKDSKEKEPNQTRVPSIYIDENPQEEVRIFYYSLHNSLRPWQKDSILKIKDFQRLKESLEANPNLSTKQERELIGNFLEEFRQQHKGNISAFIEQSQNELEEKSPGALAELAALMDFSWPDNFPGYRVVPVLLPYSPFGENVFFYSILNAARGVEQKDLMLVAIHEISHMVFYDILRRTRPELVSYHDAQSINTPIDYLKEFLAPVLMNQPSLRQFLDLSNYLNGYMGNTDLEQIYIQTEDPEEKIQISKYLQQIYERMRFQEHKTFSEIIDYLIRLVQPMEKELVKRRDLWNKHQYRIFKDEDLLKEYSLPIKVQGSAVQ